MRMKCMRIFVFEIFFFLDRKEFRRILIACMTFTQSMFTDDFFFWFLSFVTLKINYFTSLSQFIAIQS